MRLVRCLAAMVLGTALLLPAGGPAAGTLETVRQAGVLRCGVTSSGQGLSTVDGTGRWQGFFIDMCRALAAAVVGAADRVEYVEGSSENRFAMVRNGEADVVMEGTTWTLQRDATYGVDFPAIYLFDGQSFIVHRSFPAQTLAELAKTRATVCVIDRTTTLRNLEDWMAHTGAPFTVKSVRSTEGALSTFFNHHCDLFTSDRIGLHAQRLLKAPSSADYLILPEVISKEPLGPMVRADDRAWFDIVRWVFLATVLAEEKGVTAATATATAEAARESGDPDLRKLLGIVPGLGKGLGLDDRWGWRVITQVGNYGEIFDRHLGAGSPLRIERGLNALWNRGGLHYAPPLGG